MKNLLFIPCYRCENQIIRVLSKLKNYAHFFDEILIIDNISPDQTPNAAKNFIAASLELKNAKVVQNPANIGLGGSHKMAFQYAIENNFDHIIILHGDDQGDLQDFTPILESIQTQDMNAYYMGARFHTKSKLIGYSRFRIFGNIVYNILASIITRRVIYDLGGSGVNLFPTKLIKEHPFKTYANDLTFHVFVLFNALRLEQGLKFYPISWREEDQISNVRLFKQARKLIVILMSYIASPHRLLKDPEQQFNHSHTEWVVY